MDLWMKRPQRCRSGPEIKIKRCWWWTIRLGGLRPHVVITTSLNTGYRAELTAVDKLLGLQYMRCAPPLSADLYHSAIAAIPAARSPSLSADGP